MKALTADDRQNLRRIGHHLKPVILLGAQGVTPALIEELQRALGDHELIKVRLYGEDRDQRQANLQTLIEATGCQLVQSIGKIALLLRRNTQPNARLSNLQRFAHLLNR